MQKGLYISFRLPLEGDSPVRGNVRKVDKRVPPAEHELSAELTDEVESRRVT